MIKKAIYELKKRNAANKNSWLDRIILTGTAWKDRRNFKSWHESKSLQQSYYILCLFFYAAANSFDLLINLANAKFLNDCLKTTTPVSLFSKEPWIPSHILHISSNACVHFLLFLKITIQTCPLKGLLLLHETLSTQNWPHLCKQISFHAVCMPEFSFLGLVRPAKQSSSDTKRRWKKMSAV